MRKWLRPEIWLIVSSLLLALAVPCAVFARHVILVVDTVRGMFPVTVVEMEVFSLLETLFSGFSAFLFDGELFPSPEKLIMVLVLLLIPFCTFFIRSINSEFNLNKLRSLGGIVHWLLSICSVVVCVGIPIVMFFTKYFYLTIGTSYPFPLYSVIPGFAVTWLIIGWRRTSGLKWKTHLANALKGGGVGLFSIIFVFLSGAAEDIYGNVVNVYHGQPYEGNPYVLMLLGITTFLNVLLLTGCVACVAMALSFRDLSRKTRIKGAGLAVALCTGMFLFLGAVYLDNRDELQVLKEPLLLSAGLSLEEQENRTLVSLKNDDGVVVEWPVKFKYDNELKSDYGDDDLQIDDYGKEVYPATRENLEKLSAYEERSKAGFIHMNIADALIGGYTALLDVRKARESVVRNAENIIVHRLVAQSIFYHMPTTEENKALFREFTEGIDWHEDKKGAYWLCKMYKHMDMAVDGEKWCALAGEGSRGELDVDYVPVDGIIRGVISFNGRPLRRGKIVLMWQPGDLDEISFEDSWMLRKIIAVSDPDLTGEFKFTGLKDLSVVDGYELAVVFDHPLEYDVLGIDNPPGIINVTSAEKDFDLGVINIRTGKK